MPTRECSRCPLTQTLWCGGNCNTCKSSLAWSAWPDSTWLCLPLLRLLSERLVGSVNSDLWGNLLGTPPWLTRCRLNTHLALITVQLASETEEEEWQTHSPRHTHLPLRHWHTLGIFTDIHQRRDCGLYTDMTSNYLPQAYRLSIIHSMISQPSYQ